MKYKIHFRENLKKLFFPLDGIRIFLIIVAILMLGGMIFYVIRNLIEESSWFLDPRINILFIIMAIIFVIGILITIAQVLCKHTLSKFFGKFQGEFEKRFSYGFRILVIGFFISVFWDILENIPTWLLYRYNKSGSIDFAVARISISSIWNVGDLLIALYILYGFLILVSAIKYYRPAKTGPIDPTEQIGKDQLRT